MAGYSPFQQFRKNRKKLLAGLGIFTIFAFIVFPILLQMLSSGGGISGTQFLASTRAYGNFDYSNRETEREAINDLSRFYQFILNKFAENETIIFDSEYNSYVFKGSRTPVLLFNELNRLESVVTDVELVNKWLLINYAEEQGVAISKQMIEEHLKQMTDGQLTNEGLKNALQEVGISSLYLESLIRRELLFNSAERLFLSPNPLSAPISMRWDWFQRANRHLSAEVAVINVENFVSQVQDPNENELKAFFEENKHRVYDPYRPESGFKLPKKVAFQFVLKSFNDEFLETITDEEIQAYYEENKETFRVERSTVPTGIEGGLPFLGTPEATTEQEGAENSDDSDKPADTQVPESTDSTETPEPPADSSPEDTESTDTSENADVPAENAETGAEEREQPAETEPSSFSGLIDASIPIHLVTYQTNEELDESAPEVGPALEETPVDTPTETPESPTEETAEAPADEEMAPTTGEIVPAIPVMPGLGGGGGSLVRDLTPGIGFPGLGSDTLLGDDLLTIGSLGEGLVAYKPLSEVESEIRRNIAQRKATEGLEIIEEAMTEFGMAFRRYTANPEKNPLPKAVDLEELSKKYGNVVLTSELLTLYDAAESPMLERVSYSNARAVLELLYGNALMSKYSPFDIFNQREYEGRIAPEWMQMLAKMSRDGIVWIIDSTEEKEPTFEEVKSIVLHRWKEVKARELALQEAGKILEKANASNSSLAESLKGTQNLNIVETEPFTWVISAPSARMGSWREFWPGNVSEKRPIEELVSTDFKNKWIHKTGPDFMKTAYSLKIGRTGIAKNTPENEFYLVRVLDSSPSEEILNRQFLNAMPQEYIMAGAAEYSNEYLQKQWKRIRDHVEFKWGDIDKNLIPVE